MAAVKKTAPKRTGGKAAPKQAGGVMGAFTRKFHGVPAWAIIIALGLGLYLWRKHEAGSGTAASSGAASSTPATSSGYGGYGSSDGGGAGGGVPTPPDTTTPTTSSDQSGGRFGSLLSSLLAGQGSQDDTQPQIIFQIPQPDQPAPSAPSPAARTTTTFAPASASPVAKLAAVGQTPASAANQIVKVGPNTSLDVPDIPKAILNKPTVPLPVPTAGKVESTNATAAAPKAAAAAPKPIPGTTSNKEAVKTSKSLH